MVFSEMISAEAVLHKSSKTRDLVSFRSKERPIGLQLFSHDPEALGDAVTCLEESNPDAFDLNFGCPARKVVQRRAGASFLEDPKRLSMAVQRVVRNSRRPVLVKLRSGPSPDRLTAVEAAQRAQDEGASAITVHARTTKQGFQGKADWDIITKVKKAVNIPVIGNGDIFCAEDMLLMHEQTGCDAVMIGRGALGNPWIFDECRSALQSKPWRPPSPLQIWTTIEKHIQSVIADKGENIGIREMRKHLGWYSKGLPGSAQFRSQVFRMNDPRAVLKTTREFFKNQNLAVSRDNG